MSSGLYTIVGQQSHKRKNKVLQKLIDLTVCSICQEHMYVPVMTQCSHNYCYGCLKSWFCSNESTELSCPQCRSSVTTIPIVNSAIQQSINLMIEMVKLEGENSQQIHDNLVNGQKSELEKYNSDTKDENLYGSVFSNSALAVIDEDDDGIARCSNCHWELDPDFDQTDGNICPHCNTRIRNSVPQNGTAVSTNSRGFDSDEYSEGELEELETDIQTYREDNERSLREIDSSSQDEGSEIRTNFNRRFPIPSKPRNFLHDDEAEEDEDEEEKDDVLSTKNTYRGSDEEIESDLASFIASDDEIEEEQSLNSLENSLENLHRQPRSEASNEDEERDSDFYEHNDEGFVSGDSLDNDSVTQKKSAKRRKMYRVVLDESDED